MAFVKGAILALIFGFLAKWLLQLLVDNAVGVHFNNVHPKSCRIVPDMECGSEKISVSSDGLAFISSGLFKCSKGSLYTFDFNQPQGNATELKIVGKNFDVDSFRPHGMDIYDDKAKGYISVFVINHGKQESVEHFVYNRNLPYEIQHIKSIEDNRFLNLNDIAVIDGERFYVSNFGKFKSVGFFSEYLLSKSSLNTGNIVYYNHTQTSVVAKGDNLLNGITISADKSKLVTSIFGKGEVSVYNRNDQDGSLTFQQKVYIGYHPDNIFLDYENGNLYVGYIKNIIDLILFKWEMVDYISSSAVRLVPKNESWNEFDVEEVFHDNGKYFVKGLSSFVHYKGQYLLGTVMERLGYCKD